MLMIFWLSADVFRKFLNIYFHGHEIFVGDTGQFFYLRNNSLRTVQV